MEDKVLELAKSLCHGQADETLLSALCREACRRIDSRLSAGVTAAGLRRRLYRGGGLAGSGGLVIRTGDGRREKIRRRRFECGEGQRHDGGTAGGRGLGHCCGPM